MLRKEDEKKHQDLSNIIIGTEYMMIDSLKRVATKKYFDDIIYDWHNQNIKKTLTNKNNLEKLAITKPMLLLYSHNS
jgi:hypothetical protein